MIDPIGFHVRDLDASVRFEAALAPGGRDDGAPRLRADYGPAYHAAFLLDPDGNDVEAVRNE